MAKFTTAALATLTLALAVMCLHAPRATADNLPNPKALDQAYWSTPGDGRLVMLLRNAAGFAASIPFRVRVCVTNTTGVNNSLNLFVWTTDGYQPGVVQSPQPQTRSLALGECTEIDQPAAIFVQDSTTSGTATGYYELLERTAAPPEYSPPTVAGATPRPGNRHARDIQIGEPKSVPVQCQHPLPSDWANQSFYFTYCHLSLGIPVDPKSPATPPQGVRLCSGVNYITSDDKKTQYAPSLLELIIDKTYLTTPKVSDYDYNFSPITPQDCRDIIGATDIWFMFGPSTPGGYWDPSKIRDINVTVQALKWTAAP